MVCIPHSTILHTVYTGYENFRVPNIKLCAYESLNLPHSRPGIMCFEERIERCCADLREELSAINRRTQEHVHSQLQKVVNNVAAHIRYEFLEGHGPRRERVTHNHPMVPRSVKCIHS